MDFTIYRVEAPDIGMAITLMKSKKTYLSLKLRRVIFYYWVISMSELETLMTVFY